MRIHDRKRPRFTAELNMGRAYLTLIASFTAISGSSPKAFGCTAIESYNWIEVS